MVFGREGDHILANGRVMPTLRVRSGAPERWRIVNAAKSRYFLLDLDGQPFQVIGSDGGLQERPQTVTELLVTPGERVDVIVSPTRSATGSLVLHADLYNRGYGSVEFRNVEDVLTVAFDEEPTMPPAALPNVRRQFEPPLLDGATRVDLVLTLPPLGATNNKPEYQINGAPFWKAQPFHASIGDRQIWTVRNESKFAHPLHLHGFWFLPLDEQLHPIRPMAWKDTINVPVDGTVRFFVTFDERPGMWMFHCHILDHAEGGMMGHVHLEVPPTGADAGHVEGPPTGVDRGSALLGARPLQHELLHAPAGRGLADVQVALAVDAHPVRAQELADLPAAPSEITDDFEIGPPENPHLVIRPVRQVQPLLLRVGRQHGHERRA
jgi:FtsP/CotA-like multicopper oxidase with cupredoxin domain